MFNLLLLQVYLETPKGEKLAEALHFKVTLVVGNLQFNPLFVNLILEIRGAVLKNIGKIIMLGCLMRTKS